MEGLKHPSNNLLTTMNDKTKRDIDNENEQGPDRNPDPITGQSGSHPVGTGLGAAGAGAAGAAIGSLAGPVGTAVGAVIGAVTGGLAGKGVAESIDPTEEDAYWRENHHEQSYAGSDSDYDEYAPAYRTGYSGYQEGRSFDEREKELRMAYENQDVGDLASDAPEASLASRGRAGTSPDQHVNPVTWMGGGREAAQAAYQRRHDAQQRKDK